MLWTMGSGVAPCDGKRRGWTERGTRCGREARLLAAAVPRSTRLVSAGRSRVCGCFSGEGVSAILLSLATLFGVEMAVLTRWDTLPPDTCVAGPVLYLAHLIVLGTWTAAWLRFWKHMLGTWGGWRWAVSVAMSAAVAAEAVQFWLPGHIPDAAGLVCNLAGAGSVLAWVRRRARPSV